MPINLNTAISALDTPSSLLPFFVKDSFDVTGRTIMAHREGGKHEAREKCIEEAGTSLFWIGGIPAVRAIANKIFKNKLDTKIHFKRINGNGVQSYFADELRETVVQNGKKIKTHKFSKEDLEGIVLSGEKLKQIQNKLKNSGYIVNGAKGKYATFHVNTTIAAVLINFFMLTVFVPKFNQYLSRKIIAKETQNKKNNTLNPDVTFGANKTFDKFQSVSKTNENKTKTKPTTPSFGSKFLDGFFDFKHMLDFTQMAEKAQLAPTSSMLILDYGISGSRVTFVPRDNNERIEYAVKEGGIILFFYQATGWIKSGLAYLANHMFKTPIDLDYKIIVSKEFADRLKQPHNKEELLKFAQTDKKDAKSELKVIKFIDQNLERTAMKPNLSPDQIFENFTLQMAQKEGLIDVEYDETLQKWIRHSKKYIETDKLIDLNEHLRTFYEQMFAKGKSEVVKGNIENVISKTKKVKLASVIANMAICCASLSFILPKIQYWIREHRTNTKMAPGIKVYQDMADKNLI